MRFGSLLALAVSLPVAGWQAADSDRFPTFPRFQCESGMTFCNRALEAGLHGVQRYGRGAAFVDIDGDGWDDLFLADADNRWDGATYGVSMFFFNQKDGTFRPRPATELGIDDADLVSTWSASFADYDNDGDPDLLLANGGYSGVSNLAFYENRIAGSGRFVSITEASGIGAANASPHSWWGSSWADYDGDGWLDVVVTRTEGPALIFRNNGDGTLAEVSGALGVGIEMRDGKNAVWLDYDGDRAPDLYLAGMYEHAFYRNEGEDGFSDVTSEVFPGRFPYPAGWPFPPDPIVFSAAAADFDQDGADDLYLGRWFLQDVLLINGGTGRFEAHTTERGLVMSLSDWSASELPFENTMGLGVGDLFDDGYPDLWIGTGNPPRAAPDIVLCNRGDAQFERCESQIIQGADLTWKTRSHGAVFSDFDHDGDTDFAVNLGGNPPFDASEGERISPEWPGLFVNERGPSGNTAALTLVGTRSNRDAIGARIRVEGSDSRHYVVGSMQAFQSQNSRVQIVTLGDAREARVEIRWPAGGSQTLTVRAGERISVTEP